MTARRALLLAGSLWELARFFLLTMLIALILDAAGTSGSWIYPWLLLMGGQGLLVAAGALMVSLFPDRYGTLVGLLRLGKILGVFTFLLLVISRAFGAAESLQLLAVGRLRLRGDRILYTVFLLDALFLAVLLAWRPADRPSS